MKLVAATGQARHDGADRNAGDVGDFLIGKPFQFPQSDRFAKFHRLACEVRIVSERFAPRSWRSATHGSGVADVPALLLLQSGTEETTEPSVLKIAMSFSFRPLGTIDLSMRNTSTSGEAAVAVVGAVMSAS